MASNTSICGICSLRQITKTSKHWCPQCEEALCDECKEHHKLLKATRRHEPLPITSYKSLPSFIADIQQSCVYHNEQYQIYCNEHALPLCLQCINDHSKCNVTSLEKVTSNIKTSGQFLDLESRLEDLSQNIEKIRKNREANMTDIEKMKVKHLQEIKQIRVEMNNHLDIIEKQIIKDLEKKVCQCQERIHAVLSPIKEKETIISQYQANFKCIQQYASDLQIFLGMREIDKKVIENEKYLQSLIEAKCFEQLILVCTVDTGVQSIINSLKKFGSVEIKYQTCNIDFSQAKAKQAQSEVVTVNKNINKVKLTLQKKIATHGDHVRGCCMSKEWNYLLTDHDIFKSLIVIAADGILKYKMTLDRNHAYDITFVDDKTIAISSGHSTKTGIDIINIENQSKEKFIKVPGRPYGITHDHDSLFVCVQRRGIYEVNMSDYATSCVISCVLSSGSYVSIFADKIYYTEKKDHSVVCCNRNGSHFWTFKDDSVLNVPRGIAVDTGGDVYVVGETSSNVIIISNDGNCHRQILTGEDGLHEPSAISFDKQKMKLCIANAKQTAFLYSVLQK